MGKKTNARVIVADTFEPAQIVALAKACPDGVVTKARDGLKTDVYQVDMTVRIKGDIEVGIGEMVPGKFPTLDYLVAALVALDPAKRKKVLARPVVKKTDAAVMKALIDQVKAKRKKTPGPSKLTPHLQVTLVQSHLESSAKAAVAAAPDPVQT
jgi:hypothetical protein